MSEFNENTIITSINKKDALSYPHVILSLSRIPKHCGECPFYLNNVYIDYEPLFGNGVSCSCPFGGYNYKCLVERPENCPIIYKV